MPRGWQPERDPFGGYRETRSFLGIRVSDREFSDAAIDKILDRGKNPRSVLNKRMRNLSIAEKQKVLKRIQAREKKRNQ
jgi:ABC-type iron transport system FetAB ATPase subunit